METLPVIVHVGLMKTATSTLQKRIFSHHEDLNYLGGPVYKDDMIRSALASINKHDRLKYDETYHRTRISDLLAEARIEKKPILLSAESLTTLTVDRLTKVERLERLFDKIKIILSLRRPEDFLISLYSEYIKRIDPKRERLRDIDSWLASQWSDERANSITRFLDFSRLIQGYQGLVGDENVCVLLFEDLCNEPERYSQQLSDFIGIDAQRTLDLLKGSHENKQVNQLDYTVIKLSSRIGFDGWKDQVRQFMPRPAIEIIKKLLSNKQELSMSDEWRERIRAYSREINNDLSDLIGAGPEHYDYF